MLSRSTLLLLALATALDTPPPTEVKVIGLQPGEKPGSIPCEACNKDIDEPCGWVGNTKAWCRARVEALRALAATGDAS